MADQTLALANAILKEDYLGPIRSQLNVSTPVLQRLVKNTRDIVGKEAWIPLEMSLNQGSGARAESAVLPSAGRTDWKEAKVALAHYYGAMSVTGPVMRQTAKGNMGSFGRVVDLEAKAMKRTLALNLAHDFYLGHKLAGVTTQGPVTVVQLDALANMEYFETGMIVDIVDATTGVAVANGDSVTITAVDRTNKTITITGAGVTVVAGTHIVVREDTFGACVNGLFDIIDDVTTLHGIDPALFPRWAARVNAAFGAFTVSKLQAEIDAVVVASGKYPSAIYGDYTRQRKYFETLTANPQYVAIGNGGPKTMDGGFRTLEYSGGGSPIPWIADRLMQSGSLLILNEGDLQVYTPADFAFLEIGGDAWLPDILGSSAVDRYKAILWRDIQLGAMARNSHAKLLAIT